MGANVFLQVGDHLSSMMKVLDGKEDGHGERKKTNQPEDDLETEALKELDSYQGTFPLFNSREERKR